MQGKVPLIESYLPVEVLTTGGWPSYITCAGSNEKIRGELAQTLVFFVAFIGLLSESSSLY